MWGNDMYSPEYTMQWIYEVLLKHDIDEESRELPEDGYKEILKYQDYGYPSYIKLTDN